MKKKISILMLTIDRYEITKKTLENNLANIDMNYELLVCDNGSKDKRIIEFIKNIPCLSYHRINQSNEGVASSFNQLKIRATGSHICLMGNDILMPKHWASEMVKYADGVKYSGLIGMDWGHPIPVLDTREGIHAHYVTSKVDKVFGTTLFRRDVMMSVGGFCEDFNPYGLEDSDLNNRVTLSGFKSLYVPNMKSEHLGNDVGQKTEYRKMKNISLKKNALIYEKRAENYSSAGCYEPFPEATDSIS